MIRLYLSRWRQAPSSPCLVGFSLMDYWTIEGDGTGVWFVSMFTKMFGFYQNVICFNISYPAKNQVLIPQNFLLIYLDMYKLKIAVQQENHLKQSRQRWFRCGYSVIRWRLLVFGWVKFASALDCQGGTNVTKPRATHCCWTIRLSEAQQVLWNDNRRCPAFGTGLPLILTLLYFPVSKLIAIQETTHFQHR